MKKALRYAAVATVIILVTTMAMAEPVRDEDGRIARSRSAVLAFRKDHPCPATSSTTGRCPGYVVDHVVPLCADGPDTPANMQWQAKLEALEKDRVERSLCKWIRQARPEEADE